MFFSLRASERLDSQEAPEDWRYVEGRPFSQANLPAVSREDFENRLHSLREKELFFWQPTPLSWY